MNTRRAVLAVSIASLLLVHSASAASLTWGVDGAGGDGTWDTTTNSWWNSATTTNVMWPASSTGDDDAVFDGFAGTVTLATGGITANDLTFNSSGFTITGNTLTLDGATPTITTGSGITAI